MVSQTVVIGCIISVEYFLQHQIQASGKMAEEKVSDYNCFRLNSCDANGQPVCGYDDGTDTIAKFENECALFKVNCNGRGRNLFKLVDDQICVKKVVPQTTTTTTVTSPTIDYYYDLRADTEPDTSTHYWQDALMLGKPVVGHSGEGKGLRDEDENYFFPKLMTMVMRQ